LYSVEPVARSSALAASQARASARNAASSGDSVSVIGSDITVM
jgi:hypothetical protein